MLPRQKIGANPYNAWVRQRPLTPWLIRFGYEQGAFPMSDDDNVVEWYQSNPRCLFPIEGIHVSRSLAKVLRQDRFRVTFDTAFTEVMEHCLRPSGNWITPEFIQVYTEIHRQGWGHSCEVWSGERLVGGVYGIALGGAFCAESMFHRETDASKVALYHLVEKCRELGFVLFDAQIMNDHLVSLGAFPVTNQKYLTLLQRALKVKTVWDQCPFVTTDPED